MTQAFSRLSEISADLRFIASVLDISRPLTFLDCETTGVNPKTDRIVELSLARVTGDMSAEGEYRVDSLRLLIDPQMPIPAEASAVHGITNASLAATNALPFPRHAGLIATFIRGADLAGYNGRKFDREILAEEFERASCPVEARAVRTANVLDPYAIFCAKESRDLTAALKFYCDSEHAGAHGAEADMVASIRVLAAQLVSYPDLPRSVEALSEFCERRDPSWIDRDGKLAWKGGQACINFGKNQGVPLCILVARDRSFLDWLLRNDFADDTKAIVRAAMKGQYPTPPAAVGAA